jgi:iron complex transport system permease protein
MTALAQAWTELSRAAKARMLLGSLVVLLLVTFVVALASGVVAVPLSALWRIALALVSGADLEGVPEQVFVAIRLPRALLAVLTGAGLGAAGAAMQGLFRNPLADPGLMGVTAGASLATALMIVVAGGAVQVSGALGLLLLPGAAFLGALGATFLIWSFAQRAGAVRLTTLLLAGIAVNAVAFAGVGFLTFVASDAQLRELTSWNLGSLNGATWRSVAASAPFVLLCVLGLPRLARALNALALGEEDAGYRASTSSAPNASCWCWSRSAPAPRSRSPVRSASLGSWSRTWSGSRSGRITAPCCPGPPCSARSCSRWPIHWAACWQRLRSCRWAS